MHTQKNDDNLKQKTTPAILTEILQGFARMTFVTFDYIQQYCDVKFEIRSRLQRQRPMSTVFDDFQQSTKISFKSDVAAWKCLRSKTCQKTASTVTRRRPRERKKQYQQLVQLFWRLFSRNCSYLRQDFSTFVAETRDSRCLPEDPCGVLWWPARALGILLILFFHGERTQTVIFDVLVAV